MLPGASDEQRQAAAKATAALKQTQRGITPEQFAEREAARKELASPQRGRLSSPQGDAVPF